MWGYTNSLGVFELQERDGKYYFPSSMVEVHEYFESKEEASIYSYKIKSDGYYNEKKELEKRIKNLDDLILKTKKIYNIDELKKTHPEYFLSDIKYKDPIISSNLCQEIIIPRQEKITKYRGNL
jgi:hypothetical protein